MIGKTGECVGRCSLASEYPAAEICGYAACCDGTFGLTQREAALASDYYGYGACILAFGKDGF